MPGLRAQRGEPDQAQPLYERALAVYEAALGPEHAEVAHTLTDLAVLHLEQVRIGPSRPPCGAHAHRPGRALLEQVRLGPSRPPLWCACRIPVVPHLGQLGPSPCRAAHGAHAGPPNIISEEFIATST